MSVQGWKLKYGSQVHAWVWETNMKFPWMVYKLGSTDAAPEVPHPHPTRPDAATRRGRRCPRIRPRRATWIPRGFLRRAPTRADSASTRADASRFGPTRAWIGRNRPVSAKIGRYRPESAGISRYRLKRPKQPIPAEIQKKKKNPERTGIGRNWCLIVLLIVFYLVLISNLWVVF